MVSYAKNTFNFAIIKKRRRLLHNYTERTSYRIFYHPFLVGRTEDPRNLISYHMTCSPCARVVKLTSNGLNVVVYKCSPLYLFHPFPPNFEP